MLNVHILWGVNVIENGNEWMNWWRDKCMQVGQDLYGYQLVTGSFMGREAVHTVGQGSLL